MPGGHPVILCAMLPYMAPQVTKQQLQHKHSDHASLDASIAATLLSSRQHANALAPWMSHAVNTCVTSSSSEDDFRPLFLRPHLLFLLGNIDSFKFALKITLQHTDVPHMDIEHMRAALAHAEIGLVPCVSFVANHCPQLQELTCKGSVMDLFRKPHQQSSFFEAVSRLPPTLRCMSFPEHMANRPCMTDEDIAVVHKAFPLLRELSLPGAFHLTDATATALITGIPEQRLRVFRTTHTDHTAATLQVLAEKQPLLEHISLVAPNISDPPQLRAVLEALGKMPYLRTLNVYNVPGWNLLDNYERFAPLEYMISLTLHRVDIKSPQAFLELASRCRALKVLSLTDAFGPDLGDEPTDELDAGLGALRCLEEFRVTATTATSLRGLRASAATLRLLTVTNARFLEPASLTPVFQQCSVLELVAISDCPCIAASLRCVANNAEEEEEEDGSSASSVGEDFVSALFRIQSLLRVNISMRSSHQARRRHQRNNDDDNNNNNNNNSSDGPVKTGVLSAGCFNKMLEALTEKHQAVVRRREQLAFNSAEWVARGAVCELESLELDATFLPCSSAATDLLRVLTLAGGTPLHTLKFGVDCRWRDAVTRSALTSFIAEGLGGRGVLLKRLALSCRDDAHSSSALSSDDNRGGDDANVVDDESFVAALCNSRALCSSVRTLELHNIFLSAPAVRSLLLNLPTVATLCLESTGIEANDTQLAELRNGNVSIKWGSRSGARQ